MYKLLSTGTRRFYREYAWKASTAKVLPSETYPLYGSTILKVNGVTMRFKGLPNRPVWKPLMYVCIYQL